MIDVASRTNACAEVRFRYLANVRRGRTLPARRLDHMVQDAERLPYLTAEYLRGEGSRPTFLSADSTAVVATRGSIVLLWEGANAGEFLRGRRGVVPSTSALITLKERSAGVPPVDPGYFFWACKSHEDGLRAAMAGLAAPRVNAQHLANVRIRLPSLDRQRAIAAGLDRETARLDSLASIAKGLLSLLGEKQAAMISAAVAGELDLGEKS